MPELRIAFVHPPTSNEFMAEILAAVAEEVRAFGVETLLHRGTTEQVDDGRTVFVVIPHESYWFNPRPAADRLQRTIAFGVEHPGTETFGVAARAASACGAIFEISTQSIEVLRQHGLRAESFRLGYHAGWDRWGGVDGERSVELAYMGSADPERLKVLARLAPDLAHIDSDLLIPPFEQRLQPRPDFLIGEAKWRFLANAKTLLNLHRQSKTALEIVRTLEAMCNGCVVITEPSTDLGPFEPATHLVFAPREQIAAAARTLLDQPERLQAIRRAAYELCKGELSMGPSAQRLIAVAEQLLQEARQRPTPREVAMPDWPEVRPPHVPELSFWVPEPCPLPRIDAPRAPALLEQMRTLAAHRRETMEFQSVQVTDSDDAEVDVILVSHDAAGPLQGTLNSLAAQPVAVNVHAAGIGVAPPSTFEQLTTYLECTLATSIGAARNELIAHSTAPYLLVLESGDELLGDSLSEMVERLRCEPDLAVTYPMAAYGTEMTVNLFHPEAHRLARFAYLTRGYLIRRDWLVASGSFAEDPELDAYVDHDMWTRVARSPERAAHLHRFGTRLWPTDASKMIPADPVATLRLLGEHLDGKPPTRGLLRRASTAGAPATPAVRPIDLTDERQLPMVSALMGAYNYGRYIGEAIESAMNQNYPPQRLELVIVDDGSTDDTASIVERYLARYPGRIKFVQQQNGGATAATNRARREASGELIALLDADDVWVPDKTRKQVALMQRRPELGLVFSQMRLIDGDGKRIADHYGHREPMPANQFARLLWENVAVQSSLIIEANLFDQIPNSAPYADWWLALRGAQAKQIDFLWEDLVYYRWHGANITGGVGGVKALREGQKGIAFQRWVLRSFELDEFTDRLTPDEMAYVWSGLENQAFKGLSGLGSQFGQLAVVTDEDRADAGRDAAAAEQALVDRDFQTACALMLRARAGDPFSDRLREQFTEAVADANDARRLPDPLDGHDGFAVLTDAAFLLAGDARLLDYAAAMRALPGAALVIDASALEPAAAAAALGGLVERCGLTDDEITLIGVVGELLPSQRRRVARATHAIYAAADDEAGSTAARESVAAEVPTFTPGSLRALREFADGWRPRQQ